MQVEKSKGKVCFYHCALRVLAKRSLVRQQNWVRLLLGITFFLVVKAILKLGLHIVNRGNFTFNICTYVYSYLYSSTKIRQYFQILWIEVENCGISLVEGVASLESWWDWRRGILEAVRIADNAVTGGSEIVKFCFPSNKAIFPSAHKNERKSYSWSPPCQVGYDARSCTFTLSVRHTYMAKISWKLLEVATYQISFTRTCHTLFIASVG